MTIKKGDMVDNRTCPSCGEPLTLGPTSKYHKWECTNTKKNKDGSFQCYVDYAKFKKFSDDPVEVVYYSSAITISERGLTYNNPT